MRSLFVIVALLAASALTAQETGLRYSKESLMRVLRAQAEEEKKADVEYHVGAVYFNALNTRWRFNYFPLMMPLSGSGLGVTNVLPDPFALSGTPIATGKNAFPTRRQIDAELKRINASDKKRVSVKVRAQ
jgi:hypothetical protein